MLVCQILTVAPDTGVHVHPGGFLDRLLDPCRAACGEDARACADAADATALTCISDACPTEITAAQSACAEDRRSEECEDAITALRTCGQTCLDARQTSFNACRDEVVSCREACEAE